MRNHRLHGGSFDEIGELEHLDSQVGRIESHLKDSIGDSFGEDESLASKSSTVNVA